MAVDNLDARIREKIQRKMEKVSRRLEELQASDDLQKALDDVLDELHDVEVELKALGQDEEVAPGVRERLEARRERLLARQDRIELKIELRDEMRERLAASLEDMELELEASLQRARDAVRASVRNVPGHRSPYPSGPTGQADPSLDPSLEEERRKILEMVRDGAISADEAAQLLEALRDQGDTTRRPRRRPRWVRIRVTDMHEDRVRVNVTLPVGLVRAGLRAGGSIAGIEGLDTAGLEEMLDRGEIGHLLDIQDEADGERVEIFVE
jgi:DNA primase